MNTDSTRILKSTLISALVVLVIAAIGFAVGAHDINVVHMTGRGAVEMFLLWLGISYWLIHTDAIL